MLSVVGSREPRVPRAPAVIEHPQCALRRVLIGPLVLRNITTITGFPFS